MDSSVCLFKQLIHSGTAEITVLMSESLNLSLKHFIKEMLIHSEIEHNYFVCCLVLLWLCNYFQLQCNMTWLYCV